MTRDEYDEEEDDDDGRSDTTADARVMDGQPPPVQGHDDHDDDLESSSLGEYLCRYSLTPRPTSSLFPPFPLFFDTPDVVVDGAYMPW
jgi:hypothetical protein